MVYENSENSFITEFLPYKITINGSRPEQVETWVESFMNVSHSRQRYIILTVSLTTVSTEETRVNRLLLRKSQTHTKNLHT